MYREKPEYDDAFKLLIIFSDFWSLSTLSISISKFKLIFPKFEKKNSWSPPRKIFPMVIF